MERDYSKKTIKILFGRATQCAYPGCNEPLIFEDRGRLTATAEIAHIRSGAPSGPRHDSDFPVELVNSEENLLLLCGKHHKPVDDHESVYPVDELLEWKRRQVAAGPGRDLSDRQLAQIVQHYDLSRLGPDGFEKLCQALAVYVLGPGTEVHGGYGPDAGRDAAFLGRLRSYPNPREPWDGYVVMQAMYKSRPTDTRAAAAWLRHRIKGEFDAWSDRVGTAARAGRRPDYLIFATNIALSPVAGDDGKDRIDALIQRYADELGLKGWAVWDETQIATFLEAYPDVRYAFSSLTSSNEAIAEMLAELTAPRPVVDAPISSVHIRPGQPGHEGTFQPLYQAIGGADRLGEALGEVQQDELGWVQHFEGGPSGEPAVLCARFGQPVVAVARSVWNEIAAIGGGGPNGGATGAGFPVADETDPDAFIGSDAEIVELAGGRWGRSQRGSLVRRRPGVSVWQPKIAFDSETSSDRDVWTGLTGKRDLRVRVAARIPLFAEAWRISGAGRARMLAGVEQSGMGELVRRLAVRYGLDGSGASWREIHEPDGINNSRFTAHQIVVNSADGHPAVAICLRLVLPDGRGTELCSTVDLRVDFDAIAPSTPPATPAQIPAELRVTLAELIEFFAHAWQVATIVLPLAATDNPLAVPPAGAPRLEFYIQSERPDALGGDRTVQTLDMVDLSTLGSPRSTQIRDLAAAVTTPLGLPESKITSVVNDAMVRMAEDFGFTAVAEQPLR